MNKEQSKVLPVVAEIESYIKENFPVDPAAFDAVITEARAFDKNKKEQIKFLTKGAEFAAKNLGIVKVSDKKRYPGLHLPTILSVMREIEKDVPESEKGLPLPKEVELLVVATFTDVWHHSCERQIEIAAFIAKKGVALAGFSESLKRMPEFAEYFVSPKEITWTKKN